MKTQQGNLQIVFRLIYHIKVECWPYN